MRKLQFLKNIFLVSSVISTAALAGNGVNSSLNGWYAGLGAGMDLTQLSYNYTASSIFQALNEDESPPFPNSDYVNSNNQYYPYKFLSLQGGYRFPIDDNHYAFAIEVFGQIDQGKAETNQSLLQNIPLGEENNVANSVSFETETRLKYIYGLRLEPGVYFGNNTLLYGIAGVGVARFKTQFGPVFNSTVGFDLNNENGVTKIVNAANINSSEFSRVAPQAGIGMEQALGHHLSIGAHYLFSYFGTAENRVNFTSPDIIPSNDPNSEIYYLLNANNKQKMVMNELALSINYHF